jgi:hypothetical protein
MTNRARGFAQARTRYPPRIKSGASIFGIVLCLPSPRGWVRCDRLPQRLEYQSCLLHSPQCHCEERRRRAEAIQAPVRSPLDCCAEPVIAPATPGRTRWLAMAERHCRSLLNRRMRDAPDRRGLQGPGLLPRPGAARRPRGSGAHCKSLQIVADSALWPQFAGRLWPSGETHPGKFLFSALATVRVGHGSSGRSFHSRPASARPALRRPL